MMPLLIASEGCTRLATAPHVHFSILLGSRVAVMQNYLQLIARAASEEAGQGRHQVLNTLMTVTLDVTQQVTQTALISPQPQLSA
jgi:hypothetical protein